MDDKSYWLDPSAESYFYANKWHKLGFKKILDLGCGLGRHSMLFSDKGFDVTAFDSSKEAIDYLSERSNEMDKNIRCDIGDMHDLPYGDCSFDCVFAYLSISHTDTNGFRRIISEICRILVPGGMVFMTLCSKDTWSFTEAGLPSLDENTKVKTEGPEKGIPHFYVDMGDIPKVLVPFEIIDVKHVDDCFFQGRWQNSKHFHVEARKMRTVPEGT